MDAKEISEKHAKATAARTNWAADMFSRVIAAGQSVLPKKDQVRTASAPERTTPFTTRHAEAVGRIDTGHQASGPRDLRSLTAQDKDRQINNAVARARQMVEKKLASMPITSPDINYLRAEISRWDDHTGQPQTGRISFQIPFSGPKGDPRTIYAAVDLVMGDLMEPRTFNDGLNNAYAFDVSGLKQLFQGQDFEVVSNPKIVPETKYSDPNYHSVDGIPGTAAVDSPLLFRKASPEIVKQASGAKPQIAREGLIRPLSKEANQIGQKEPAGLDLNKARKPSNAGTSFNVGTSAESNTPYDSHSQGGQSDPTLASAEVREINWDGSIRTTAKGADLKKMLELAHAVTYGGHDYVVEVWNEGKLVERIASSGKRENANLRFATAIRVMEAGKSKHEKPGGDEPSKKAPKKEKAPAFDMVGSIMAFEQGTLEEEDVLKLFQHLVDTGMAWSLQGSYGRAAKSLLDQGLIQPANSDRSDAYGQTVPGQPRDDQGLKHEDSPSLEDEGNDLGSYESAAKGTIRVASLSKVIKDLNLVDVRMINFRDLVMMCKQHGQEQNLSFDSASKELAKAGIILYRTASGGDDSLSYRVAHAKRTRLAAPEGAVAELPGSAPADAAGAPGSPSSMAAPAPGGAQGTPQIAPPSGLDPVEFREFQSLLDQYNNEWETVHQRELNNIKNGNQPHMGIDYVDLQTLYDKIEAFQESSKQRKSDEIAGSPADLAAQPKTAPAAPAEAPGAASNGTGESTLMPEKGHGLAGQVPKMTRASLAQALDMKEKGTEIDGLADEPKEPKTASAYDLDDDAKNQMITMGKDPGKPEDVKEFMGTFKKVSSQSLDMPEVCKNCKSLVVPNGYSNLREFKHTRKPFCGAAKVANVGFVHAYFRDCVGYDPIVKDIKQKIEMKAPESEQTEKDSEKGIKPIMERAGGKFAGTLKAESLPSAAVDAVREKPSQTGVGLDIREWCEKNGHYAPAGDVHPTHDWCTLWNTAVENLTRLPSGAVVPKSMSGQSAESNGEGGPHQFGNNPNQAI